MPDRTKSARFFGRSFAGSTSAAAAARGLANWLCLAATPIFAGMALLAVVSGNADMDCMTVPHASPLSRMALMYLLMSVFHSPPWVKLVASGREVSNSISN